MGNSSDSSAINEILEWAQERLKSTSDAPALDAQWLLLQVLNKNEVSWLYTHAKIKLNNEQKQNFAKLLARRAKGEPLAYILGEWEFYGRRFYVNSSVLIPRPSTELLIEKVLRKINSLHENNSSFNNSSFVIADIGTGSGCVIITLCLAINQWSIENMSAVEFQFIATDISPTALHIARKNAKRHGVVDRVKFIPGNMLEPLKNKHIDLIVSNPPYIPSRALSHTLRFPTINTQGLTFEPTLALDGGAKGDKYINKIEASGIPAVVEIFGGEIDMLNEKK